MNIEDALIIAKGKLKTTQSHILIAYSKTNPKSLTLLIGI